MVILSETKPVLNKSVKVNIDDTKVSEITQKKLLVLEEKIEGIIQELQSIDPFPAHIPKKTPKAQGEQTNPAYITIVNLKTHTPEKSFHKITKPRCRNYSVEDVSRFFQIIQNREVRIKDAALMTNIPLKTATYWVKKGKSKSDILARGFVPTETCREFVQNLFEKNPSLSAKKAYEIFVSQFPEVHVSMSWFYRFIKTHCYYNSTRKRYGKDHINIPEIIEMRYNWVGQLKEAGADFKTNCIFISESQIQVCHTSPDESKRDFIKQRHLIALSVKGIINFERAVSIDGETEQFMIDPYYSLNFIKRTLQILSETEDFGPKFFIIPHQLAHSTKIENEITKLKHTLFRTPLYSLELNFADSFWHYLNDIQTERVIKTYHNKYTAETAKKVSLDETAKEISLDETAKKISLGDLEAFYKRYTTYLNLSLSKSYFP